ncbi:hypothetical protein TNCT_411371 [Trichonephila clavata]|uniref:Uncharacterized protein n=1 Tax=Trichonephila clavata TaxID=2740835 RepID=A0A8X6KTM6_TRICU|nr:hypothetical protein TNCT_411371 [Trichonephila clavata]
MLTIVLRVIFGGRAATAWVIASFSACRVVETICLYTLVPLSVTKEKIPKVINLVTFLGVQAMCPPKKRSRPGNNSLRMPSEHREV